MAAVTDWKIKSRADACGATGKPFADQDEFVSRLRFEEGEYYRDDFSLEAWDDAMREDSLSVWRSVWIAPPPPEKEALKPKSAEAFLRKLMEENEPESTNSIFILAVSLERKRVLVEKDVQIRSDGVKIRVYEHKVTGDTFVVPDPGLHLDDMDSVAEEVAIRLGWIEPEVEAGEDGRAEESDREFEAAESELDTES